MERSKRWYIKNKKHKKQMSMNQRAKRAKEDRCLMCGIKKHPEADNGYKNCINCREGFYATN